MENMKEKMVKDCTLKGMDFYNTFICSFLSEKIDCDNITNDYLYRLSVDFTCDEEIIEHFMDIFLGDWLGCIGLIDVTICMTKCENTYDIYFNVLIQDYNTADSVYKSRNSETHIIETFDRDTKYYLGEQDRLYMLEQLKKDGKIQNFETAIKTEKQKGCAN